MKVRLPSIHLPLAEVPPLHAIEIQLTDLSAPVELLARCRAGDEAAWRELYEQHVELAWRVARRLGTPEEELEDVCQEAFVVAFRKLSDFREGRFSSWLYRIVANVVSDRHRRRRVRQALAAIWGGAPEPVVPGPDSKLESEQTRRAVAEVLARLAPKKREVFALYELEGLSGEEIAERVGCKLDTVWTRLHYARKDFERLYRKRGGLR